MRALIGPIPLRLEVFLVSRIVILACVAGALVGSSSAVAQEGGNTQLEVIHASGSVYMLQAPGGLGNMGVLVGPEGALLIDDHLGPITDYIMDAVAEISPSDIRFLINTHVHPDHIGGNEQLGEEGVTIFAHDNVRLRMLAPIRIPRRGGTMFPQPPEGALPVVTYSDGITFYLNDEEVRVFLSPAAHTDGDSFIHFVEADVLHLGDVFRTNMYPIIDRHNGGSFLGMIDALEIAIGIAGPETVVIPGHGFGTTDRGGMLEVLAMMLDVRESVRRLVERGASLQEVMDAGVTVDLDARWGRVESWTAADLIPIVFEELSQQN